MHSHGLWNTQWTKKNNDPSVSIVTIVYIYIPIYNINNISFNVLLVCIFQCIFSR
jgi:hypothetical protein